MSQIIADFGLTLTYCDEKKICNGIMHSQDAIQSQTSLCHDLPTKSKKMDRTF